ncbi:hypothetical protein DSECCO2_426170 [anaerobic digester metagenome]
MVANWVPSTNQVHEVGLFVEVFVKFTTAGYVTVSVSPAFLTSPLQSIVKLETGLSPTTESLIVKKLILDAAPAVLLTERSTQ